MCLVNHSHCTVCTVTYDAMTPHLGFSQIPSDEGHLSCELEVLFSAFAPPPRRTLGGVQKRCWTRLNTWATSASATWNPTPSLSLLRPALLPPSCLSTPMCSHHPTSPRTPTRASPPPALELHSRSPRSNPCDAPRQALLCKRQHDSATKASWKTKLC